MPTVETILAEVAAGTRSVDDALRQLKKEPFEDLGFAKVDHHRALRQGAAEVIYGEGKSVTQIAGILDSLAGDATCVLVTRLDADKAFKLAATHGLTYHPQARLGMVGDFPEPDGNGPVVVAAAGTSDLPVAEEAALTAQALGNKVVRVYDVGVAGLHRLLANLDQLLQAQVIIAVAGMEGALPSVVAGLVSCPVIAVPTSVGYGASFKGVTALLAMLNSCASGVSVVNIDNGFGAAYQAHQINHLRVAGAKASSVDDTAAATSEATQELPVPQPTQAFTALRPDADFEEPRQILLDLSVSATRKSLLMQLEGLMDDDTRKYHAQILRAARVPNKHHHNLAEIYETIDNLVAPDGLKDHLRAVYGILAQAESHVHKTPVEETHFHEVGNGLSILNALSIAAAFYVLEPSYVRATPVQTGCGTVEAAHGIMDIPAPATAAILETGIPTVSADRLLDGELCTPTSAALIKHFVQEFVGVEQSEGASAEQGRSAAEAVATPATASIVEPAAGPAVPAPARVTAQWQPVDAAGAPAQTPSVDATTAEGQNAGGQSDDEPSKGAAARRFGRKAEKASQYFPADFGKLTAMLAALGNEIDEMQEQVIEQAAKGVVAETPASTPVASAPTVDRASAKPENSDTAADASVSAATASSASEAEASAASANDEQPSKDQTAE